MRIPQPRPGLTLLEMTIVLTILAVLTTLAISLTEGTVEQTRFDVTQRQLQEIHRAIVGPDDQPDGPSFLSDVGRLPLVVGTDPGLQLGELWAQPSGVRTFSQAVMDPDASTSDVNDTEVKLLSGWRGPYLRLAPGRVYVSDGWNQPFTIVPFTSAPTNTSQVSQVISAGGPEPYNIQQSLPVTHSDSTWKGTVSGSVVDSVPTTPGMADVIVQLFIPDATLTAGVRVQHQTVTADGGYQFTFPDAPVGPKALRAYRDQTGTAKSGIYYFHNPPGGVATRTIYMDLQ